MNDLGAGGVSLVEFLILYERWAGERLVLEMSIPKQSLDAQFQCRLFPRDRAFILALLQVLECHVEGFRWLAWWSWQVHALSLTSVYYWLGKVWSWSYV